VAKAGHEALAQQGIITPLVFCRRQGQPIRSFLEALADGVCRGGLSRSDPA
jgi:hypothetical protein